MAVHPQRTTWTDERLDDLSQSMRDGFDRVDRRFDRVDQRFDRVDHKFDRIEQRFERNDQKFERVDDRFDQLAARIDSLQLALVVGMIGIIGAIIASSIFG